MKLAIFDFDGTLLKEDTIPYLMEKWNELGYSRNKYCMTYVKVLPYYLYYLVKKNDNKLKIKFKKYSLEKFMDNFAGMKKEEIEAFFIKVNEGIENHFRNSVIDEIFNRKKEGYHLMFLSGAYEVLLRNVGKRYNFHHVLGTKILYNSDDIFEKKFLDIIDGLNKNEKLMECYGDNRIDWEQSYAYGDSITDLDILNIVGNPVVVCPDPLLRKIASAKNWRIIEE